MLLLGEQLMYRTNQKILVAAAIVGLTTASAMAQSSSRGGGGPPIVPVAPRGPVANSVDDNGYPILAPKKEKEGGWLFNSSWLNVGKPEVKAPEVQWNGEAVQASVEEKKSRFMQPIHRARDAAKGAMQRTRTAWSDAFKKVKPSGESGSSSRFASWFGGGEKPASAVAQQPDPSLTR